ncbi:Tryprostatin B 6-hydroxylase [Lachnellula occidentalis]|uniref:Tryprostatin B 6-hydroxylase n=1 Tax=Lachnellula occidentalis TaxID=215460 RepID=A0A8H8UD82_9HELO|nr:Tryprostatin B 6-hydroxylase [Lachnellula occidentalis]
MMSQAFSQMMVSFLLVVVSRLAYLAYFSPLSNIPNAHFTSPFTRAWLIYQKFKGCENRTRLSAHEKLGPVVRLGPNEISINHMDYVCELFNDKSFTKTAWYPNGFRGWKSPILASLTDPELHSRRRQLMATRYTNISLQKSAQLHMIFENRVSGVFREELQIWASTVATIDIFQKSKACLMDIITAWLYGIDHGTNFIRDVDEERTWSTDLNGTFEGFVSRSEFYWFISALERSRLFIFPWMIRTENSQRRLQDWSLKKCKHVQESSGDDIDNSLCSQFRQGLEKTEPAGKVESLLMDEMLDHCITGQLPTGIIVSYAVWELAQKPEWRERLHNELAHASDASNANSNLSPAAVDKLPILNAVVMETLRVYSSNPGPWPRFNPTNATRIGQYSIPAGTTISASSYCLHRNENVFPQPNEWRPERWLKADDRQRSAMNRWFWAFGSGPFMCLGSHFAILGMSF